MDNGEAVPRKPFAKRDQLTYLFRLEQNYRSE